MASDPSTPRPLGALSAPDGARLGPAAVAAVGADLITLAVARPFREPDAPPDDRELEATLALVALAAAGPQAEVDVAGPPLVRWRDDPAAAASHGPAPTAPAARRAPVASDAEGTGATLAEAQRRWIGRWCVRLLVGDAVAAELLGAHGDEAGRGAAETGRGRPRRAGRLSARAVSEAPAGAEGRGAAASVAAGLAPELLGHGATPRLAVLVAGLVAGDDPIGPQATVAHDPAGLHAALLDVAVSADAVAEVRSGRRPLRSQPLTASRAAGSRSDGATPRGGGAANGDPLPDRAPVGAVPDGGGPGGTGTGGSDPVFPAGDHPAPSGRWRAPRMVLGLVVLAVLGLWWYVGHDRHPSTGPCPGPRPAVGAGARTAEVRTSVTGCRTVLVVAPVVDGGAGGPAEGPGVPVAFGGAEPGAWEAQVWVEPDDDAARVVRLGSPDDVVLVGDWDCDGRASLGLHRLANGETWLASSWTDEALASPARSPVEIGDLLEATDFPGCDVVVVARR